MNMDDDWGYPHFRKPPYRHFLDEQAELTGVDCFV